MVYVTTVSFYRIFKDERAVKPYSNFQDDHSLQIQYEKCNENKNRLFVLYNIISEKFHNAYNIQHIGPILLEIIIPKILC